MRIYYSANYLGVLLSENKYKYNLTSMRCNNAIIFFRFDNLRCRSQGVHEFESDHYLDNKIHGENFEWHPRCRYTHRTVDPATSTTCYKFRDNNSNGKQIEPFMKSRGKGDLKEDVKKIWRRNRVKQSCFISRTKFFKNSFELNIIYVYWPTE